MIRNKDEACVGPRSELILSFLRPLTLRAKGWRVYVVCVCD